MDGLAKCRRRSFDCDYRTRPSLPGCLCVSTPCVGGQRQGRNGGFGSREEGSAAGSDPQFVVGTALPFFQNSRPLTAVPVVNLCFAAYVALPGVSLDIPDTPEAAWDRWARNKFRWTCTSSRRISSSSTRHESGFHPHDREPLSRIAGE